MGPRTRSPICPPLSDLTDLLNLQIDGGVLTSADLAPLSGMTWLQNLTLQGDLITDVSWLSNLTVLDTLNLDGNEINNLSGFPASATLNSVSLSGNQIKDPSPLVVLAGGPLNQLDLSDNEISDASSLAALEDGGIVTLATSGLINLSGNRISDFSAFQGLSHAGGVSAGGQTVYAGHPTAGKVSVDLKAPTATAPTVSPASAGSYDASTGTLTVTDPSAASLTVSPDWTVELAAAPGDPGGPTIAGTATVDQNLTASVSGAGSALAGCTTVSYQWLRDGAVISGTPLWSDDLSMLGQSITMGGPGNGSSYIVGVTDMGHQLSVQATCKDSSGPDAGVAVTSNPTAVVASGYAAYQPMVQTLQGGTSVSSGASFSAAGRSGAVGDPTNPGLPVYLSEVDGSGHLVDVSGVTISVQSIASIQEPLNLAPADITFSGTGAERTINFAPTTEGGSRVTFKLTGTTGLTSAFTVDYQSLAAMSPTARVLEGSSDDSSAIDAGDGYFFEDDDEKPNIRLYNGNVSGREVAQFAPPSDVNTAAELDLEASAQEGNTLFFFGSEGNDKDGKIQPNRNVGFSMTLHGSGANATLTPGVALPGFRNNLVSWDEANGNKFGLAAGTAKGVTPQVLNGLDLEGTEFSPDDSELYLGMRAPIYPATPGGDAVIFTVTNFNAVVAAVEAGDAPPPYTFGSPILLNLGGDSIREIRKNADDQYLIISGASGDGFDGNKLWAWDGQPTDAPQLLTSVLPPPSEPFASGEEPGTGRA